MNALEKAARAACREWYATDLNEPQLTKVVETSWDEFASVARAVLMAVLVEAPTKAMAESRARDDEGEFEPLCVLIGFSGENKTRTVLRQAWEDGIKSLLAEPSS